MSTLQPKVALGDHFLSAFAAIPKQQQRAVSNFVAKFRANPTSPGINYETIHHAQDKNFRSVRIDQNYRGIISKPEKGNVYILLWVDKHDEAYAWARRHRCAIHPETGVLQLFEVESSVEEAQAGQVTAPVADASPSPLFNLDEKQLLRLGVPVERLALVQSLVTEEQLEQIEPKLPIEAFEALYLLAAGVSFEEVLAEAEASSSKQEAIDTEDYGAALEQAGSQRRFFVPEDDQELARMLNAPLDKWRVFLHPTQRSLVERDWNGPVRVLGGAGTGKTVVAMHRAKWLVAQEDWAKSDRLLFTTFSSNLAIDIQSNLQKICTPEQLQRIEVVNLDRWVSQFIRRNGYQSRIVYPGGKDGIYDRCWESALALKPMDLNYADSFYQEEWQRVVLAQNIRSQKEYLFAERKGRGVALTRRLRAAVWVVFEEMREQLALNDCITAEDASFYALELLQSGEDSRRYRAVVVDETQDFGPVALQLLRQLVREDKNDMFLVGDAHQRIYQQQTPLSHSGINIMGRGRKLKINYRTTERIRAYAMSVLEGVEIDDLDEGLDQANDYRSLVMGQPPQLFHAESFAEEVAWVVKNIQTLREQGIPLNEIAIVARTNAICAAYEQALQQQQIPTYKLSRQRADNPNEPGVRLATMHRVKGLEFRCVMLVSINQHIVPLRQAIHHSVDPVEQRLHDLNERALLHVAATRAAKALYIASYGQKSELLGA